MQAVLTSPIVTDYVPVARPPWVAIALIVGLLAVGLRQEPLLLALSTAAVLLGGCLTFRVWGRPSNDPADAADDFYDSTPPSEPSRWAA